MSFKSRLDPEDTTAISEGTLQRLLAQCPELLPVEELRPGTGALLCIGREVPTKVGKIDNLYVSSRGYLVCVETKLWRNPEAKRHVLAQVLDYSAELAHKDYAWLEGQWDVFAQQQSLEPETLFSRMARLEGEHLPDPGAFANAVERNLARREWMLLVVGDGIHAGLQRIIDELTRDSALFGYRLALVELACYRLDPASAWPMVIVPAFSTIVPRIGKVCARIDND